MLTAETVFIIIVAACVIIFAVAMFKIFKKKSKGSKGAASKSKSSGTGMPKADMSKSDNVKVDKMENKAPKINKEKLKKIEDESANIKPAFSKDELETERKEQIQKDIEKDLKNQKKSLTFPGFSPQGFSFPMSTQTRQFQPKLVEEDKTDTLNNFNDSPTAIPVEAKEEDKDFIEMLKKKGVIKQEQSFGESLIIKEAIDTPVSKQEMKKKRQKWM